MMATRIPFTRSTMTSIVFVASRTSFAAPRRAQAYSSLTQTPLKRYVGEHLSRRLYSAEAVAATSEDGKVEPPDYLDEAELDIFKTIKTQLDPTLLEVQDISGGCGSMYALDITSPKFAGLTTIKQHRLVNAVLGERIKQWHGVQLKTRAPAP